jgi:hypothetical protein
MVLLLTPVDENCNNLERYIRTESEIGYPLAKNGHIFLDNMEQAEELVIGQSEPGTIIISYHITNIQFLEMIYHHRIYASSLEIN